MNIKKTICLLTCFAMLLCATACRKTNSGLSSVYSYTSTITEVYHEIIVNNSSENTTTSEITQSSTTSTTSSDAPESKDDEPVNMEEKYGFNTLQSVEYSCVRDIPTGETEYKVDTVLTDKGSNISYMTEIISNTAGVTVDGFNITIPYEYRKNNKSVNLTARHKPSGVSVDFTLTFNSWNLIFEDEFNGTEINKKYWGFCPNYYRDKGYANTWKDEYTFVDGNGHLVSRAYATGETNDEGKPICYSGALWSKNLFESTYGYYEVRAKLHHNIGMWGAFWIVAGDMDEKNPPSDNTSENGAEIDIFESLYNHGGVSHALHWDGWTGNTKSSSNTGYITQIDTFDNEFHTFALHWSPTEYVFMVDGYVTRRIDNTNGICNQPGYINLTTECGTWAGDFTLKKGEYSDMLIDYVRVYTTESDF